MITDINAANDRIAALEAKCALLRQRSQAGIAKYGTTLAAAGCTRRELVQHALEEALDLANYLQADLQVLDRAPVIAGRPTTELDAALREFLAALGDAPGSYEAAKAAFAARIASPTADQQAAGSVEAGVGKAMATATEGESVDEQARNALLWFYRRTKPSYGRLPFAEEAISALTRRIDAALDSRAQPVSADSVEVAWVVVLPSGEPELSIVYTDRNEAQDYIENRAIDGCTLRGLSFSSAQPVAPRPTDDELWDQTIRDRDTYHEWADKLAEAISKHFGTYIGEHSNTNCPWAEALEAIDSAQPVAAGELLDALRRVSDAALYVTNAAYNLGQSHEQWPLIKARIASLDDARRHAHDLIANSNRPDLLDAMGLDENMKPVQQCADSRPASVAEFLAAQRPLDADAARILHENIEELYATDEPADSRPAGGATDLSKAIAALKCHEGQTGGYMMGFVAARDAAATLAASVAPDEIARLTEALAKANAQAEHFEREWYLRGDEIEELKAKLAATSGQQSGDGVARDAWVSVDERLPDTKCIATYANSLGNRRTIIAKYVPRFTVEAQGEDCYSEYREDDDTEYLMPGWYECIDNWGEYSSVFVNEGEVTHWMPLPAAITAATTTDGGRDE